MAGFEWQDKRGVEGTGFVRTIRSLLTSHLPVSRPKIEEIIQASLDAEIRPLAGEGNYLTFFPFPLPRLRCVIGLCEVALSKKGTDRTKY